MAQSMKDVTSISIPVNGTDKVVKKIQRANGDIIWADPAEYPYRRLKYINMNGRYIDTGYSTYAANAGYQYAIQFSQQPTAVPTSGGLYFGDWLNTTAGPAQEFWGVRAGTDGQIYARVSTTYGPTTPEPKIIKDLYAINDLNASKVYEASITNVDGGSSTSSSFNFKFKNITDDTTIINSNDSLYMAYLHLNSFPSICINSFKSKATDGTTTISSKGYVNFNLYRFYIKNSSSNYVNCNYFPAQRKSDNVVGIFNCLTQTFRPILNATDDSDVVETNVQVADEYWDLTAPA